MTSSTSIGLPSTVELIKESSTRSSALVSRPIFLVGSERSGTTLTRLMLDHHPQIAFFFEFQYSVKWMPESGGWPNLDEYRNVLRSDRIFRAARLDIDESLDYQHLVDSFLQQKRQRDGKPLVGATVHYNFDRLLHIWPDARFIHIVRDGRDVARSVIEQGWAGNTYVGVEPWIDAESLWAQFRRELPADRWTEIQYETLCTQPESTLRRLCEFLGVPYDPAMMDYTRTSTYGPPSPKAIGQWRRKLSPTEVQLAETRIGNMLLERGYELSGQPMLEISPAMDQWLRLGSRYHSAKDRIRRFGFGLFFTNFLARRLGLKPLQSFVQARIDAITDENLK